ncbi:MAG: NfeD family protein [Colwellia sp.]|nr:NfeD family protein [Colwellia sp.]
MQYFFEHHDHLWFLVAGLSFIIELSIMGLSGPLLFFAIASLFTGILVSIGFIDGWQSEVLTVGLLSVFVAITLWKPLKRLQDSKSDTDNSSDMIGLKVLASSDITEISGSIRYSGIDWQARLAEDANTELIKVENQCSIVAITGNTMLVKLI